MERTSKAILAVFVAIALFIAIEALVSGSDDGDDEEEEPDYDETVYYTLVSKEFSSTRYDEDGNEIEKDADSVTERIRKAFSNKDYKFVDLTEDDVRWICLTFTITAEDPDPTLPNITVTFTVTSSVDSSYTFKLGTNFYYSDTDYTTGEDVTVHIWYLVPKGSISYITYNRYWTEV